MVLDKLRLKTRKEEANEMIGPKTAATSSNNIIVLPPSASKGGVSEKMIKVLTQQTYNCKNQGAFVMIDL